MCTVGWVHLSFSSNFSLLQTTHLLFLCYYSSLPSSLLLFFFFPPSSVPSLSRFIPTSPLLSLLSSSLSDGNETFTERVCKNWEREQEKIYILRIHTSLCVHWCVFVTWAHLNIYCSPSSVKCVNKTKHPQTGRESERRLRTLPEAQLSRQTLQRADSSYQHQQWQVKRWRAGWKADWREGKVHGEFRRKCGKIFVLCLLH